MNDQLEHHGIFGMHWGVRRYQNKDGSLTMAGKNRYKDSTSKEPVIANNDYARAHEGKSVKEYSDKELQQIINRINMERQYDQYINSSKGKSRLEKAEGYIDDYVKKGKRVHDVISTIFNLKGDAEKIYDVAKKILGREE